MKVEITVHYPWADVESDSCIIQISENINKNEIKRISFEYVLDLLFERGINWDYKIINKEEV